MEYCGCFTDAAVQIQEGKGVAYTSTGEDGARCEAKLPEGAVPTKIAFKQVTLKLSVTCNVIFFFNTVDLDS